MATTARHTTPEEIRDAIGREREELARAVSHLRDDLRDTIGPRSALRKAAIGGAALVGTLLAYRVIRTVVVLRLLRSAAGNGHPRR